MLRGVCSAEKNSNPWVCENAHGFLENEHDKKEKMGPMRFERTTSRLSAGCTTSYATGPRGLPYKMVQDCFYRLCIAGDPSD